MAKRPPALPPARARGARGSWLRSPSLFIGIFLAVQLLLPLTYYTVRTDRHDERWAWRMFSPERMVHCEPTFLVDERREKVDLMHTFHEAWSEIAGRGRLGVIERMAKELCKTHDEVRGEMKCRALGEKRSFDVTEGYDVCLLGKLK